MNDIDTKILEYLERAHRINYSYKSTRQDFPVIEAIEIAKMIQKEEFKKKI